MITSIKLLSSYKLISSSMPNVMPRNYERCDLSGNTDNGRFSGGVQA